MRERLSNVASYRSSLPRVPSTESNSSGSQPLDPSGEHGVIYHVASSDSGSSGSAIAHPASPKLIRSEDLGFWKWAAHELIQHQEIGNPSEAGRQAVDFFNRFEPLMAENKDLAEAIETLKNLERELQNRNESTSNNLARLTGMIYRRFQQALYIRCHRELKVNKTKDLKTTFPLPASHQTTSINGGGSIPVAPSTMTHLGVNAFDQVRISDTQAYMRVREVQGHGSVGVGLPGVGLAGGWASLGRMNMEGVGGFYKKAYAKATAEMDGFLHREFPKAFNRGEGKGLHRTTMNEAKPLIEELRKLSTDDSGSSPMNPRARIFTPDVDWIFPWRLDRYLYGLGATARGLMGTSNARFAYEGSYGKKVLYEDKLYQLKQDNSLLESPRFKRVKDELQWYDKANLELQTENASDLVKGQLLATEVMSPFQKLKEMLDKYSEAVNAYEIAKRDGGDVVKLRQNKRDLEDESRGITSHHGLGRLRHKMQGEALGRAGFYSRMTILLAHLETELLPLMEKLKEKELVTDDQLADLKKLINKCERAVVRPEVYLKPNQVKIAQKLEEQKEIYSRSIVASAGVDLSTLATIPGLPGIGAVQMRADFEARFDLKPRDDVPDYEGLYFNLDLQIKAYIPPAQFTAAAALIFDQIEKTCTKRWGKNHSPLDPAKIKAAIMDALDHSSSSKIANGMGARLKLEMRQAPSGRFETLACITQSLKSTGFSYGGVHVSNDYTNWSKLKLGTNSFFYLQRQFNGGLFASTKGKEGELFADIKSTVWEDFKEGREEEITQILRNMGKEGNSAKAEYEEAKVELIDYLIKGHFRKLQSFDSAEREQAYMLKYFDQLEECIDNLDRQIDLIRESNGDAYNYQDALKALEDFMLFIHKHSYEWKRKRYFSFPRNAIRI